MFAISYDGVRMLGDFSTKHGMTFPLLSDEGSRAITELGLLDRDLDAHHEVFGVTTRDDQRGVAYPVTFVLDETGVVERKSIEENYRIRHGGTLLLGSLTGAHPPDRGLEATARSAVLSVRVSLDSPAYFAYRRQGLAIALGIQPSWHVYGPQVPDAYTGLHVNVRSRPGGLRTGEIRWPGTSSFQMEGSDERFEIYEGAVDLLVPVIFLIDRGTGPVELDVEIEFQACSASECLPPSVLQRSLTVPEAPTL